MDPYTTQMAAAVCLALFGILGAFDGIYFHMIKYKLYLHPPAQFEHQLHTFRGFLFVPIVALFFYWNVAGPLLWLGIGLLLVDFIAEIIDIAVEKEARAELGGISSAEAAIHVTATGFRMAALAIVLVAKPIDSFAWTAPSWSLPSYLPALQTTAALFLVGIIGALGFQFIKSLKSNFCRYRHFKHVDCTQKTIKALC